MMAWQRRGVLAAGVGLVAAKAASGQENTSGLFDVAVIGAGVFGAWAAWHLHTAGKRVALIDAYGAGHARSSSGGESRVIRISYGGDPLYSAMAIDSLAQWDALSCRQTLPILHRTGVLWFSPQNDDYMKKAWPFCSNKKFPTVNLIQRNYPLTPKCVLPKARWVFWRSKPAP
jgi:sarcosine oxidase